jgi:hypothetical protein
VHTHLSCDGNKKASTKKKTRAAVTTEYPMKVGCLQAMCHEHAQLFHGQPSANRAEKSQQELLIRNPQQLTRALNASIPGIKFAYFEVKLRFSVS